MKIKEAAKLAIEGIRTNPMRAFLTSLGVVIGVAAVIVIIAMGEGARAQVVESIEGLGSNIIFVTSGEGKPVPLSRQSSQLDNSVFDALVGEVKGLDGAAAELTVGGVSVRYGKAELSASVIGATFGYLDVRGYKLGRGRPFTEAEMQRAERVAILAQDLADQMFPDEEPVGRQIKVNGTSYKVVGVYAPAEATFFRTMTGFRMYQLLLPITTVQRRMSGDDRISTVYLKVADAKGMDAVKAAAGRALVSKMGYEENFNLLSQADLLDSLNTVTRTLTYLLASIAGVSLVVGGIGIMNIMLVSVTERIKEIGIRMALGATKRDILAQFLMEAVMISFTGGAVGMALGWALAALASRIAGWPGLVPWYAVALALTFSIGIGLFFGVYPANKAASLQPVDALRYE